MRIHTTNLKVSVAILNSNLRICLSKTKTTEVNITKFLLYLLKSSSQVKLIRRHQNRQNFKTLKSLSNYKTVCHLRARSSIVHCGSFYTIINTNVCYVSKKCIDKFRLKDQIHQQIKHYSFGQYSALSQTLYLSTLH